MTLATAATPLPYYHPYSDHPSEDNNSLAPHSALSWLRLATAPSSSSIALERNSATGSSSKYRTLSSIHYSITAQKTAAARYPVLTTTIATVSASLDAQSQVTNNNNNSYVKPGPLDGLDTSREHQVASHRQQLPSIITSAIQDMDNSHGTCFLTWIHNPANLDYISLRLGPLCLEYPLVDVATVLRWIGADWSSANCKALFRAVTQSWDQGKRRMLAFLLIRDEDMRQKAKTKLVAYAQKSSSSGSSVRAKTHQQLRRPYSHQPQPQQEIQQSQHLLQERPGNYGIIQNNSNASTTTIAPLVEPVWQPTNLQSDYHNYNCQPSLTAAVTPDNGKSNHDNSPYSSIDLAALEAMAANFMITGVVDTDNDMTASTMTSLPPSLPVTHNRRSKDNKNNRFSPYSQF